MTNQTKTYIRYDQLVISGNQSYYYFFHFFGWYVVAFGNELLGLLAIDSFMHKDILSSFLSISMGCLFTHSYRLIIKRFFHFEQQPLWQLITAFLAGALLLPIGITYSDTWLEWWLLGDDYFNFVDFTSLMLNVGRYVSMWLILYFFYQLGMAQIYRSGQVLQTEKKLADLQTAMERLRLGVENWEQIFMYLSRHLNDNPMLARQIVTNFSEMLRDSLNYKNEILVSLSEEMHRLRIWAKVASVYIENLSLPDFKVSITHQELLLVPTHSLVLIINFICTGNQPEDRIKTIEIATDPDLLVLNIYFYCTEELIAEKFLNNNSIQNLADWIRLSDHFVAEFSISRVEANRYTVRLPVVTNSLIHENARTAG